MDLNRPELGLLPESALVLAAQGGDQAAFSELVRRRETWLRTLLRRMCGSAEEADELAQEAFLRAWRRLRGLNQPAAFAGWLRRIAVHIFIDQTRRSRVETDDSADAENVASEEIGPDRVTGARLDVERALALLSPGERLCIILNLGEGMSHGEISSIAGLPLGTVKSHVLRGTAKLRKFLGEPDE